MAYAQRPRIYAGLKIESLSAEAVAKFIFKSSLLLLSLNKVFSVETTAETCTTVHC